MFLPDRYIKGECPKCGAKDQYGDSCENCGSVYAPTDLKNPYSTLTGATPVLKSSEHFFFRCPTRAASSSCRNGPGARDADGKPRLQPEVLNKAREWLGETGTQLGRLGHLARCALLRHPDSRRAGQVLLRLARCAGRLPREPEGVFRFGQGEKRQRRDATFAEFLADPDTEQIHFIGKDIVYFHTLFWPAMLKFAGAPYKVPDNVYVHGFITVVRREDVEVARHRHQPRKYLDLGLNPEWLRYYIAAKLNAKVEDIDFNPDDFVARVNSDLIGKYVNIASRCAAVHHQALRRRIGCRPSSER